MAYSKKCGRVHLQRSDTFYCHDSVMAVKLSEILVVAYYPFTYALDCGSMEGAYQRDRDERTSPVRSFTREEETIREHASKQPRSPRCSDVFCCHNPKALPLWQHNYPKFQQVGYRLLIEQLEAAFERASIVRVQ
ncbi:uncharacterized protein LOC131259266 [Anopheles coustani]|uniref:uncharacterized protein LOC131259266 n=1 Tax=Anopheles coustani TaxID=139045 RepID=UPI002657B5EA|nr:uncharacterized protein LOC131259266 [Anopheles coustani]